MTGPVRVGVLGCADIARRRLLPAIGAGPSTALAAVASRDHARAAEAARPYGATAVAGYDRLLERVDVDAVYVPLPNALHAHWVRAALLAGKHVLAEKPLTTDPALTRELIALAAGAGLVLMENVMFVHHLQHEAVRRLTAEGAIGEPRSLHATFTVPRLRPADIRYRADLGGGALADLGVYPVRAAMHLLGPDLDVVGALLAAGPGHEVDTSGSALLRAPGGVAAHLAFGLDHGYLSGYELRGSLGRLVLDRAFTPPADHRPVARVETTAGVREITLEPDDQVANAVAAFAAAVRAGAAPVGATEATVAQADLLAAIRRRASLDGEPAGPIADAARAGEARAAALSPAG